MSEASDVIVSLVFTLEHSYPPAPGPVPVSVSMVFTFWPKDRK
jgi:hypothetical protein